MDRVEISSGGVRLSVGVAGAVDAPVLLLLHGWPQSGRGFSEIVPFLEAEYRLIVPDQRGFGASDKPLGTAAYSMPVLMSDALALIEWSGAESVGVVGHDFGGAVAWALGSLVPDRVGAMVVMASPHPLHFRRVAAANPAQMQRSFYVWLMHAGPAGERLLARDDFRVLSQWAFGRSAVTEEDRAAYRREWAQPGSFTAMAEWYRANYRPELLNPEVPLDLAPVTVPVRYLAPESDLAFVPGMESGSGDFVTGEYDEQVIGGTSHWMVADAPQEVAALIGEWFRLH